MGFEEEEEEKKIGFSGEITKYDFLITIHFWSVEKSSVKKIAYFRLSSLLIKFIAADTSNIIRFSRLTSNSHFFYMILFDCQ